MATGGPILDYLKRYGSDERFEFLFTGYQSEGTLGRDLTDGRQRQVSVEGVSREVRARIRMIKGLSAHADEEDLFSIFQYAERREKF